MNLRIAIICPIFSKNVSGGAERHAYTIAKLLNPFYQIKVLTTMALDYRTWKNEAFESKEDGFDIHRFKNLKSRNKKRFEKLNSKLILKGGIEKEYESWLFEQGPTSTDLIEYIHKNQNEFDLFIFFTYLYYPIVKGIESIKNKSILIPTLHDESVAYFPIFKKIYTDEIYYAFNTIEEYQLFKKIFGFEPSRYKIVGMNISETEFNLEKIDFEYFVYLGRVDKGKGIIELIDYFLEWNQRHQNQYKLVIIGSGTLDKKYINNSCISYLGYLSENDKLNYIKNSIALINPSSVESFSIAIMEAWLLEKPVLVNSNSEVMKGHCIRSNAGFYYSDKSIFFEILNYIIKNPITMNQLGMNGKKYVLNNFNSEIILKKFKLIFNEILKLKN
jgi:glycosyltransferase involved in cell wall biosynthesis